MKIENEFTPYKQALALKELGFDEPCLASWTYKTRERIPTLYGCGALLFDTDGLITNQTEDIICSAPLYQQAFRWFREKYKIECYVNCYWSEEDSSKRTYYANYNYGSNIFFTIKTEFSSYEEAELECLKKLIEIVKTK